MLKMFDPQTRYFANLMMKNICRVWIFFFLLSLISQSSHLAVWMDDETKWDAINKHMSEIFCVTHFSRNSMKAFWIWHEQCDKSVQSYTSFNKFWIPPYYENHF